MKKSLFAGVLTILASPCLFAANYSVEIQNLTHSSSFGPLLVSAHPSTVMLFAAGMPSSTNLQKMAEGGDISGLTVDMANAGGDNNENPAGGLLAPGASTMADLGEPSEGNTLLSISAMLVPSNDAFVALNGITLPTTPGTYTYLLNTYDAGTEANDEIRGSGMPGHAGMPVAPPLEMLVGTGGTGIASTAEGFVHIHRGVLGDHNLTGGMSDINASSQRWLNPVARVTVTVE